MIALWLLKRLFFNRLQLVLSLGSRWYCDFDQIQVLLGLEVNTWPLTEKCNQLHNGDSCHFCRSSSHFNLPFGAYSMMSWANYSSYIGIHKSWTHVRHVLKLHSSPHDWFRHSLTRTHAHVDIRIISIHNKPIRNISQISMQQYCQLSSRIYSWLLCGAGGILAL